jgi:hypothetical protein
MKEMSEGKLGTVADVGEPFPTGVFVPQHATAVWDKAQVK